MGSLHLLVSVIVATLPVGAISAVSQSDAASSQVIPAEFHGVWDANPRACTADASDMRLYIGADGYRVADTVGGVRRVRRRNSQSITVLSDNLSDGGAWTDKMNLSLSPDGNELTLRKGKMNVIRVRCPASS